MGIPGGIILGKSNANRRIYAGFLIFVISCTPDFHKFKLATSMHSKHRLFKEMDKVPVTGLIGHEIQFVNFCIQQIIGKLI